MTRTIERIAPHLLHPNRRYFLDYVAGEAGALRFVEHAPAKYEKAAETQRGFTVPRQALVDRLRPYNERLDPSHEALANIDRLAEPGTLCVIGGQQAGFLGGPAFAAYKALAVVRAAAWLAGRLRTPVVPIFWLASEDHDFTEINRLRTLDDAGDLRAVSFDWDGRGRPIEQLPVTAEVHRAMEEALTILPEGSSPIRDVFLPDAADDYARWHARIWSRLFSGTGLVLVEPRIVRPLAGPFFAEALVASDRISEALDESSTALRGDGYEVSIDPEVSGGLFTFAEDGRRVRCADPRSHVARAQASPTDYSPDALLRPLLADSLFPTVASIVGPSELAYQATLLPIYRLLGVPQPVLLPRHGYTLLTLLEAELLDRCGLSVSDVLADGFDPKAVVGSRASPALLDLFANRRTIVREALGDLADPLSELDPGLPARLAQTQDRVGEQIDRLEERAVRADLARHGISLRELRRTAAAVRPTGRPQERVLSLVYLAARHGLAWLSELESAAPPNEYAHTAVVVGDPHEP